MATDLSFADNLAAIIGHATRELARAERFLQVIYEFIDDDRIALDVRLEYVNRAMAANRTLDEQ